VSRVLCNKEQNSTCIYKKFLATINFFDLDFYHPEVIRREIPVVTFVFFLRIAVEVIADDNFVNLIGLRARTVTRNDFYPIRWAITFYRSSDPFY